MTDIGVEAAARAVAKRNNCHRTPPCVPSCSCAMDAKVAITAYHAAALSDASLITAAGYEVHKLRKISGVLNSEIVEAVIKALANE